MITLALILHMLVGVGLLGAITHQAVSSLRKPALDLESALEHDSFLRRYSGVRQTTFTTAVVVLYVAGVFLGAMIYPAYRLEVRIPFEEMSLGWAVGLFELKEHFAGLGLGLLPLYAFVWRANDTVSRCNRSSITALMTFIVWWDFIVGHVLNNIRGLS